MTSVLANDLAVLQRGHRISQKNCRRSWRRVVMRARRLAQRLAPTGRKLALTPVWQRAPRTLFVHTDQSIGARSAISNIIAQRDCALVQPLQSISKPLFSRECVAQGNRACTGEPGEALWAKLLKAKAVQGKLRRSLAAAKVGAKAAAREAVATQLVLTEGSTVPSEVVV